MADDAAHATPADVVTIAEQSAAGLRPLAWLAAVAYVVVGLGAMLALSPTVPYADPWRFYARFLTEPFPANVASADNGHIELLP
ncbi:MAG: hypothetical protein JNK15_01175, partial [Planctomycetes bacterium]|nr:hypothetical protein [Planctomycetota bacterium]